MSLEAPVFASIPLSVIALGDRRLEGETYLTAGYRIRAQVTAGKISTVPMSKLAKIWQPSRLAGVQLDRQHGTPFFTATQVFDIKPRARKWLASERTPDLENRYIKPGWILVTSSGSVGDSTISYSAHDGVIISHDLLRVQTYEDRNQGFLYAYLKSVYCRLMMKSTKYGNIIKHLEPEHVQELPVPLVSEDLRKDLGALVSEVFRLRGEAFRLMEKAEARYVAGLGLKSYTLAPASFYEVSASEMFRGTRRLDGFFYNPDAKAASRALKGSGHTVVPLACAVDRVFGMPRFKHIYKPEGIPYLDSEDLFKVNPEIEKFIPLSAKKNAEAYFVQRDWLLMACSGQLHGINGSVVLANVSHEGKIVSNHVLRILPKKGGLRPGYLQVALGHPVFGRPLVLRSAFGTEVPEIAPEDIEQIPVVEPPVDLEKEISALVERVVALRLEADARETEAIGRLENALEQVIGPPVK